MKNATKTNTTTEAKVSLTKTDVCTVRVFCRKCGKPFYVPQGSRVTTCPRCAAKPMSKEAKKERAEKLKAARAERDWHATQATGHALALLKAVAAECKCNKAEALDYVCAGYLAGLSQRGLIRAGKPCTTPEENDKILEEALKRLTCYSL